MGHPTAYIVHETLTDGYVTKDTRSAAAFGERKVLVKTLGKSNVMVDDDENVIGGSGNAFIREATLRIREGLADYTRDDYLVLVGNQKLIAIASAVAAHRAGGFVRLLAWNISDGCYEPFEVEGLWEG